MLSEQGARVSNTKEYLWEVSVIDHRFALTLSDDVNAFEQRFLRFFTPPPFRFTSTNSTLTNTLRAPQ